MMARKSGSAFGVELELFAVARVAHEPEAAGAVDLQGRCPAFLARICPRLRQQHAFDSAKSMTSLKMSTLKLKRPTKKVGYRSKKVGVPTPGEPMPHRKARQPDL
jgi:hypothetical protein